MKNQIKFIAQFFLFNLLLFVSIQPLLAKSLDDEFKQIRYKHRINVHGDEFMSLAKSSDEKLLAIGTEKGELIIWNIAEKKIVKRFSQNKPIHAVEFLKDNEHVITAGGNHTGIHNCSLRNWNISKDTFDEFACNSDSILLLSVDKNSGLMATTDSVKNISVWDSTSRKMMATWDIKDPVTGVAMIDKKVFFSSYYSSEKDNSDADISTDIASFSVDEPKKSATILIPKGKSPMFYEIKASPNGKYLSSKGVENDLRKVFILDAKSGKILSSGNGNEFGLTLTMGSETGKTLKSESNSSESAWISNDEIVLFDDILPKNKLKFNSDGTFTNQQLVESDGKPGWHGAGDPDNVKGIVASKDGKNFWAIFQIFGALAEYNPDSKKYEIVYNSNSLPFAMDVKETSADNGYLATCGDDKFIRVWNLADLSLKKEFKVNLGAPQGVALMTDGKTVVYSSSSTESPSEIFSANLETGETKKILSIDKPFVNVKTAANGFVYNLLDKIILASAEDGATKITFPFSDKISMWATSANAKWLAVEDKKGSIFVIDTANGNQREWKGKKIESTTNIAITDDGQYIYVTNFQAGLYRLETDTTESKLIVDGFRGQAKSLRLSVDEKFAIIGGNHRDIGVYNLSDGETLFYDKYIDSSDFYITNVWMKNNRLIFTTDGGVMFDGILEK